MDKKVLQMVPHLRRRLRKQCEGGAKALRRVCERCAKGCERAAKGAKAGAKASLRMPFSKISRAYNFYNTVTQIPGIGMGYVQ